MEHTWPAATAGRLTTAILLPMSAIVVMIFTVTTNGSLKYPTWAIIEMCLTVAISTLPLAAHHVIARWSTRWTARYMALMWDIVTVVAGLAIFFVAVAFPIIVCDIIPNRSDVRSCVVITHDTVPYFIAILTIGIPQLVGNHMCMHWLSVATLFVSTTVISIASIHTQLPRKIPDLYVILGCVCLATSISARRYAIAQRTAFMLANLSVDNARAAFKERELRLVAKSRMDGSTESVRAMAQSFCKPLVRATTGIATHTYRAKHCLLAPYSIIERIRFTASRT